jgi:hypothetical protein
MYVSVHVCVLDGLSVRCPGWPQNTGLPLASSSHFLVSFPQSLAAVKLSVTDFANSGHLYI